jgi:hypothetical protein
MKEGQALFADRDFNGEAEHHLMLITNLSPPSPLSPRQTHRMDDLASLFETAGIGVAALGAEKAPDRTSAWLRAVAELGGFDLGVLSAQASQLATELVEGIEDHLLPYALGEDRQLTSWELVRNVEETREALVGALGRIRGRDHRIEHALYVSPARHKAIPLLEKRLEHARNGLAETLAWSILLCAPDADTRASVLVTSDDPMMRMAAALWWSFRLAEKEVPRAEFLRCLRDDDENVRNAALAFVRTDELTDEIRLHLARVKDGSRTDWQCRHCGTQNTAEKRACPACGCGGPDARGRATELLSTDKSNVIEWLDRVPEERRVRRKDGLLR